MNFFGFFKKKKAPTREEVVDTTPTLPLAYYGRWVKRKNPTVAWAYDTFYVGGMYLRIALEPFPYVNVRVRAQITDSIGFDSKTEDCKKKVFYHSDDIDDVRVREIIEDYEVIEDERFIKKLECLIKNIKAAKAKVERDEQLKKNRFRDSISRAVLSEKCND